MVDKIGSDLKFITENTKNAVISTQHVGDDLKVEIALRVLPGKPKHTITEDTLELALTKAHLHVAGMLLGQSVNNLFSDLGTAFKDSLAEFTKGLEDHRKEKNNGGTDTPE